MGRVYDTPSEVKAEDGVVVVDGPDGVDVELTPDAAFEISDRLWAGATEAHGQRVRSGGRGASPDGAANGEST